MTQTYLVYITFILCFLIQSFSCQHLLDETVNKTANKLHREQHAEQIEKKYNFHLAKKQGAVKEAVNFLVKQVESVHSVSVVNASGTYTEIKNHNKCTPTTCPLCEVTFDKIQSEGMFIYLGDNTPPPYNYTCFSMRLRYHNAPLCDDEEDKRGVKSVYKWKFLLRSAYESKCYMPLSLTPSEVMLSHMKTTGETIIPNKPKTILMLGLSFMGEPFMSLGCLFGDDVIGGGAFQDQNPVTKIPTYTMDQIRKDGGNLNSTL